MRESPRSADLAAIPGARAAEEEALPAVDLADRVQHRERRLVARALGDLGLRRADARVALKHPLREVSPAHALADEGDLRVGLHCHLPLDLFDDADDGGAGELGERRTSVAEDPGVAVVVGADRGRRACGGECPRERVLGPRVARVLEVVLDPVDRRIRSACSTSSLEPPASGFRPSRGRGRSGARSAQMRACLVADVVRIEQDDTGEACRQRLAERCIAARRVFRG